MVKDQPAKIGFAVPADLQGFEITACRDRLWDVS
jgi:hypothetical protein